MKKVYPEDTMSGGKYVVHPGFWHICNVTGNLHSLLLNQGRWKVFLIVEGSLLVLEILKILDKEMVCMMNDSNMLYLLHFRQ